LSSPYSSPYIDWSIPWRFYSECNF